MSETSSNNKRIAKNTIVLYVRTIFVMAISLYTSRVILNALGVEDYGIYNAVGGMVAMFSVVSASLSSAISRFITFELGKGNLEKLKTIFSTSVTIQIGISLLVIVLGEVVGIWFLNTQMNIPHERMAAANWVLQCSIATFCINLISVPYNASIIAHEHMSAFAYISILEAVLKLLICWLIVISPYDKLVVYSLLLAGVAVVIRIIYGIYCHRSFAEARYRFVYDREIFREMTGFAGWSFLTNTAYIFNTQGINLLINIFFGVTLNAARGIVNQVEHAVMQFVNNFTTALNPQITKSYAAGETEAMFKLVCRGAKFSYYLMLLFSLPLILEAEYVLVLWLKVVPEHAVIFLRLSLIATMANLIGNTGITACMATGNIRRYTIWITLVGILVFPLTWIAFVLGAPVEATYIIFFIIYIAVDIVRLVIMKSLLKFPPMRFVREVVKPIVIISCASLLLPYIVVSNFSQSFVRLVLTVLACTVSLGTCIYFCGLTRGERQFIMEKLKVWALKMQ